MTALRATYPTYQMVKDKIALTPEIDVDALIAALHKKYESEDCNTIDGLKIDFPQGWVHLRKSNTEPIIRVYAEHDSLENAQALVTQMKNDVDSILN
jgi:phosphomannomutase